MQKYEYDIYYDMIIISTKIIKKIINHNFNVIKISKN